MVKRIHGILWTIFLLMALAPVPAHAANVIRLNGADRYHTMRLGLDRHYFDSDSVVIATGANFPDALAASALAGSKECPIVLTPPDELSDRTKLYLEWAKPTEAYIIGGESAVSSEVEESLRGMGMETNRVFGADRYDTSLRVMEQVQGLSDTVIVATGKNYADTLSIGPWSYVSKSPVVLAGPDGRLSDDALQAIADGGFSNYLIVGGTLVVSPDVEDQLADLNKLARLGGADRYETSRLIADWELSEGGMSCAHPFVATGENFPDALAGASLSGAENSIMVLTGSSDISTLDVIFQNADEVSEVSVLGGGKAVNALAYNALARRFGAELETGWQEYAQHWHYFDEEGNLLTGLQTIDSNPFLDTPPFATNKFYFDDNGSLVQDDFRSIGGKTYYFCTYGNMKTAGYGAGQVIGYDGACIPVDQRPTGNRDADAQRVARVVAQSCGPREGQTDLQRVKRAAYTVSCFCTKARYTSEGDAYFTAYGLFIAGEYTCAGATDALGMVLSNLGYNWQHIHKGEWTHQWCVLTMDGQEGFADGQIGWAGYGKHPVA